MRELTCVCYVLSIELQRVIRGEIWESPSYVSSLSVLRGQCVFCLLHMNRSSDIHLIFTVRFRTASNLSHIKHSRNINESHAVKFRDITSRKEDVNQQISRQRSYEHPTKSRPLTTILIPSFAATERVVIRLWRESKVQNQVVCHSFIYCVQSMEIHVHEQLCTLY